MTKEQIYDAQISPLMAQIIAICKEHKIATLCTFGIPNEDDPDLVCTTALLATEHEPTPEMLDALRNLYEPTEMVAETITTRPDGSQRVTIQRVV